ncbi:hypothetical protein MASR2M70_05260 [Bacillota bacterium]
MQGMEAAAAGVSMVLYIGLISGLCLTFYQSIYGILEKARMIRRLRARGREGRIESPWERSLGRLIRTGTGLDISPMAFVAFLCLVFIGLFFAGSRYLGAVTGFIIAASAACLPCLLLWIRTGNVRRRGSYEGDKLISELLREYRINNFNIFEALEKVSAASGDMKITSRFLSRLLYELRNTGDPLRIKRATDEFACAIDTNWSRMLGNNIYIAAAKGSDISRAMEDIQIQLREAKTTGEERKRLNNEARRMTFFMVPAMYAITVLMSVKYLDVPLSQFIRNQFATPEGLILVYFIALLFVGNIAILQLVTNRRFDY